MPNKTAAAAAGAAGSAKAPKKSPLERHQTALLQKRAELLDDLAKNREVSDGTVDEQAQDMVDRATSAYTREFAFSLSEADRKTLVLIEAALERMEKGTYGTCAHCAGPMQEKRLEAVPWARHCIDCQDLQDKGQI